VGVIIRDKSTDPWSLVPGQKFSNASDLGSDVVTAGF